MISANFDSAVYEYLYKSTTDCRLKARTTKHHSCLSERVSFQPEKSKNVNGNSNKQVFA